MMKKSKTEILVKFDIFCCVVTSQAKTGGRNRVRKEI